MPQSVEREKKTGESRVWWDALVVTMASVLLVVGAEGSARPANVERPPMPGQVQLKDLATRTPDHSVLSARPTMERPPTPTNN